MDWAFEQHPVPGHSGGSIVDTTHPRRVVLHTTEGGDLASNLALYGRTGNFPTITASPRERKAWQHIPFSQSATALMHPPGTVETNRLLTIQIEICEFAANAATWSDDVLRWLAEDVLLPIERAQPFELAAPDFLPYPDSYGVHAPQRFSEAAWLAFAGVCGHEHVPNNDHGDPGDVNIDKVLGYLRAALHPKPTVKAGHMPALVVPPLNDDCNCPSGGAWGVSADGAVITFGSAPYLGGANGKAYFRGHTAQRIKPRRYGLRRKVGYTITAEDGAKFSYPE